MKTLVEVSKVSGELIRPCISALVISLLEVLSDTEPPVSCILTSDNFIKLYLLHTYALLNGTPNYLINW